MTEPVVTLTDYAVALESILFLILLWPRREYFSARRYWLMNFFASVGAASLFGGTVHGFFLDEQSLGCKILWPATLLAMGVTAMSMWAIGAGLLFSQPLVQRVSVAAGAQFVLYAGLVLFRIQEFWVGIADNLPALLFLLLALGLAYRKNQHRRLLLATAGPALVFIAAVLQYLQVGIHPLYFNHNALYHVLQAIAIFLLFQARHWLLGADEVADNTQKQVTIPGS